jgi:hypothetical protein
MKWGMRLFVLAESGTGYVHSIIPHYGKLTGDKCNLPYPEKPFIWDFSQISVQNDCSPKKP